MRSSQDNSDGEARAGVQSRAVRHGAERCACGRQAGAVDPPACEAAAAQRDGIVRVRLTVEFNVLLVRSLQPTPILLGREDISTTLE